MCMEVMEALLQRQSVKSYLPTTVDKDRDSPSRTYPKMAEKMMPE